MLNNPRKATLFVILFAVSSLTACRNGQTDEDSLINSNVVIVDDTLATDSSDYAPALFQETLDSVYQLAPKNVFEALLRGHQRYLSSTSIIYSSADVIPDSLLRKKPFLLLTDIDLPQSPDKIFDLRRPMFIQLSSPACLVDPKQVAVMEYAVNYSGTRVIVVLANSNSRIIGAACDNVQTGGFKNITSELSKAMKTEQEFADRSSSNKDFVNNIAQNQARLSINQILQLSPQLKQLSDSGKIVLKSLYYDGSKRTLTQLQQNATLNTLTKN